MDLLVGVLYQFWDGEIKLVKAPQRNHDADHAAAVAVSAFLRGHARELDGYEPVASRGGLVALRRSSHPLPSVLCLCNPMTEQLIFLPRPAILDESHVLLPSDDDGGRSFHLHVVNIELLEFGVLQIQSFSSETGIWGPVVATCITMGTCALLPPSSFLRPSPLVLHGVAYWLCVSESENKLGCCYVLVLHLDGSRPPAQIKLPDRLLQGRTAGNFNKDELLLASTAADGRLSLVVVRNFTISTWTLEEDMVTWRQSTVVDLWRMTVRSPDAPPLMGEKVRLECFAERSGAVLFQLYHGTLYELDMQTSKVRFVGIYSKRDSSAMCGYDMYPGQIGN